VSYVTERAVFELENGSVTLTEIAPGVRLEEDILARMGFKPRISPQLKDMDPRIFRSGPMGIAQSFMALPARPRKVA
jgi:propionate CoA-transferase